MQKSMKKFQYKIQETGWLKNKLNFQTNYKEVDIIESTNFYDLKLSYDV